jgi:transposase
VYNECNTNVNNYLVQYFFIGFFCFTFGLYYKSLIMSAPKQIKIIESISALKKLQKDSIPMIATRIRVIIEFKKHETFGISKRAVADAVGVNHNSVQTWRTLYEQGGIAAILKHDRKDGRPSNITSDEHKLIEQKLKDPNNGLRGYVELLSWVEEEFKKSIKYNTLLKYATRHFGSKVKVARKSHVKKDDEAVITFKKTLVNSVKKKVVATKKNTKR